jgi:DNA (cytosine-5)-methyltransferase 1
MSLFSGVGGFELAAEWAGWKNVMSCEINTFGHKVLSHYCPEAYHHNDVHTLNYELINEELTKRFGAEWRSNDVILTGGFPCQPYSVAGKRLGKNDTRHLWPEMLRIISEVKPAWVVGENVRGLVSWNGGMVFDEVQADLEAIGYEVLPFILPACAVNAPHRRDRVWFVAYSNSVRLQQRKDAGKIRARQSEVCREGSEFTVGVEADGGERLTADTDRVKRCERRLHAPGCETPERYFGSCDPRTGGNAWNNFPTQSPVRSRNDGISAELVGITFPKHRNESIKAYGNAVVPQVVYQIFQAINNFHELDYNNRSR